MSDETTTPETVQEETAFIVVKRPDGSYYATTDLTATFEVNKRADTLDVKRGCQDVLDAISHIQTANVISELLKLNSGEEAPLA